MENDLKITLLFSSAITSTQVHLYKEERIYFFLERLCIILSDVALYIRSVVAQLVYIYKSNSVINHKKNKINKIQNGGLFIQCSLIEKKRICFFVIDNLRWDKKITKGFSESLATVVFFFLFWKIRFRKVFFFWETFWWDKCYC